MIRRFLPADGPRVLGWVQDPPDLYNWCLSQAYPPPADVFAAWHADPEILPFVLEESRRVAYGELWLEPAEDLVELARLLVDPAMRGQGLGQLLVSSLLAQAKQLGFAQALLRVLPENARALNCYQRAGFAGLAPARQAELNQGERVEFLWMAVALS